MNKVFKLIESCTNAGINKVSFKRGALDEAKFGSVEWQDEQIAKIKSKLEKDEPLDGADLSFIEVQKEHNRRAEIEELEKMWKASGAKTTDEAKAPKKKKVKEKRTDESNFKTKQEFIDYLEDTLIPDLRGSGSDATADDFEEAIMWMKKTNEAKLKEKAKKITENEYLIFTGNAQLVYGIEGTPGEQFEVTKEGTMLPKGKYEVIGKEGAQHILDKTYSSLRVKSLGESKQPVIEATNLDLYKKLVAVFSDFTDQHPGSGIGKIYRALLSTGLKAIPKDKLAQEILNSFVSGSVKNLSVPQSVHQILNKNFSDLPYEIKPVYKDGNKRLVPFWCKGETLCSRVIDLLSLDKESAGKWTDEKRGSVKLEDNKPEQE